MSRYQTGQNHTLQRTGASGSAQSVFAAQWRLAPVADDGRQATFRVK